MRRGSLLFVWMLGACSTGGLGDHCSDSGDCDSSLQCVDKVCIPHCQRAPECGDGYSCDAAGICRAATGTIGASCASEVDCLAGLSCQLDDEAPPTPLTSSCQAEQSGRAAGDVCQVDADCRNSTCALGHCIDLCSTTRDCPSGTSCAQIPRVGIVSGKDTFFGMFGGCLASRGTVRWSIPTTGPQSKDVLLPIPDTAQSVAVTFDVDDPNQKVGAVTVDSPTGVHLVVNPLNEAQYFMNPVRHRPELGQSVLVMPSEVDVDHPFEFGAYSMEVASFGPFDSPGSATPTATAVIKVDTSVVLDLHFYFLNLDDHPCAPVFGSTFDAQLAQAAPFFQQDYLTALREIFGHAGIELGTITYEDLRNHPELDGLESANAPQLLALGAHDTGINVFFVRTLSPAGLEAFGPNPGPAGLASTPQSGIVIGLDSLCYRAWTDLARQTAHELARYMGLYDNVDIDGHSDPINDSDASPTNLMFYSDEPGTATDLSDGQRQVLVRSGVLR